MELSLQWSFFHLVTDPENATESSGIHRIVSQHTM